MKKVLISTVVLGVILFSCSKENIVIPDKSIEDNYIIYELDKIPLTKNKQDINTLLTNPDDADDEKITKYIYELSLASRELVKDFKFNKTIIELAKKSENKTANLLLLESVAPNYYKAINDKLAEKGLSIKSIAKDLTHAPIAPNPKFPETSEIEKYVPAIFIPNLDKVNLYNQPLVSPNIVLNGDIDKSVDDNIIIWYYSENEKLNEIVMNENTSINTSNPIFILNHAVTTLYVKQNSNSKLENSERSDENIQKNNVSRSILEFHSHEYGIKSQSYRYERWGDSEYTTTGVRFLPGGDAYSLHDPVSSTQRSHKIVGNIPKSGIGPIRYNWTYHASNWQAWSNPWTYEYQNGVNMVWYNNYERDWNESQKSLGVCSANGTNYTLGGNMRFSSEWYTWIPSTTNIHFTRFQWIYNDWQHWNSSWKSHFRLWRVHV